MPVVTIRDIARETGLSPATVARALGEDGPARPETREKVRKAAARLGYVASSAARSMRNQSSNMLGLIVPDIVNRFYSEMAQSIAAACDARGMHFLLSITDDDQDRELDQMRAMVAARAAAVALVPGPRSHPDMAGLVSRQPFIQLVRKSDQLSSDWFGFDEEAGIEAATSHLLDLGHRHIMLVCSDERFSTGCARQRGYRDAFANRGLAIDPDMMRSGVPTLDHGHASSAEIPAQVTAIIAAGALLTEGVVDAVSSQGRRVPEDLSIVGFGIENWHRWWLGGMTRISPPVKVLADSCADHLLAQIDKREIAPSSEPHIVQHVLRLEVGRTTGPPRRT